MKKFGIGKVTYKDAMKKFKYIFKFGTPDEKRALLDSIEEEMLRTEKSCKEMFRIIITLAKIKSPETIVLFRRALIMRRRILSISSTLFSLK